MRRTRILPVAAAIPWLLLLLLAILAGGCASPESDMPWGAPEPWEGSPYVPGLPGE